MTTNTTADPNSFLGALAEERRAAQTVKIYILLGWMTETFFLFFNMWMFPQIHPPLIPRLIWTQIFCGIGMGAAAGGLAYLATSRMKLGSRRTLITTALVAGFVYAFCGNVCFFVDTRPTMDYWGSTENPLLFVIKGNTGGWGLGFIGSWLLNTQKGRSVLNKIPFLR